MFSKQQRTDSLVAYPAIFDLRKDDSSTSAERMNTLASLPRQERPYLLIIAEEPTRQIRFLWEIEPPPFSYADRTAINGHIVAFSRAIVAGDTPPTISISDYWWDLEDRPVLLQHTAASKVTKLKTE